VVEPPFWIVTFAPALAVTPEVIFNCVSSKEQTSFVAITNKSNCPVFNDCVLKVFPM